MKKYDILISSVLACLLVFSGIMQMYLKTEPQVVMLVFGVTTLIILFLDQKRLANGMFIALFGVLLAALYFILMVALAGSMSDPHIDELGRKRPTMPMVEFFLGLLGALILTPLTISAFFKTRWDHRNIKIAASALFCAITAVIFIVREVRYW